jgi:hypothetical protein
MYSAIKEDSPSKAQASCNTSPYFIFTIIILHFKHIFRYGDGNFNETHAFVGYRRDTAAAVVFQASRQLESLKSGNKVLYNTMKESIMFRELPIDQLKCTEEKGSWLWKQAVCSVIICLI